MMSENQCDSRKVLLVSPDWVGPIRNGGIGTAFLGLATALVANGWDVTALYTLGEHSESAPVGYWVDYYKKLDINFIALPDWKGPRLEPAWYRARSYEIYKWISEAEGEYDLLIFPEWRAQAYYSLWARHSGIGLINTKIIVVTHSPTEWAQEGNYWLPQNADQVDLYEMEPVCVELADYVISPSKYLFHWMEDRGWRLPAIDKRKVIRNLMPPHSAAAVTSSVPQVPAADTQTTEWVFFGRLEPRKGLDIFCRALDRLEAHDWDGIERVTFLGKRVDTDGFSTDEYLKDKLRRWPVQVSVIDDKDSSQALEYLSESGRQAVIASLIENSPYTVLECLSRSIRFIATNVGGIPELIDERDHVRVLFSARPSSLADLLRNTRHDFEPARLAISESAAIASWNEYLSNVLKNASTAAKLRTDKENPRVSVCLVHYDRPRFLAQAIESLRNQTYINYEVILVDDGSRSAEAVEYLAGIAEEFSRRGWTILKQDNAYLGAARNNAARHAQGEYLLFMDDDNLALPHEIETFVRAAVLMDADVVTCPASVFSGTEIPKSEAPADVYWLPLGRSLGVGMIRNGFGDANALVKRSTFERMGGFTEDYGVGHEDWEFFAKAALGNAKFAFVPEPLFRYRVNNNGMLRGGDTQRDHYRSFRPYLASLPPGLGAALGYGLWLHLRAEQAWTGNRNLGEGARAGRRLPLRRLMHGFVLVIKNRTLRLKFQHALKQYGLVAALKKGVLYLKK